MSDDACRHERTYSSRDPDNGIPGALPPDPYTMTTRLCDDAGMVSGEVAFSGPNLTLTYLDVLNNLRRHTAYGDFKPIIEPFVCTGHAHLAGEHILCTSPAHKALKMWSEQPGVYVEPDGTVIKVDGTAS